MPTCKWCGGQGDEFGLIEIWGYDWDSDDDTALSVQRVIGHQCANRTHCARQVVAQGDNVGALRIVAADYEHLGELATQAREILSHWAQLYREIAEADEASAREHGYGAIGAGVPL